MVHLLHLGSGLLAMACSGSTAPYSTDADRGSTHAVITVERRDTPGAATSTQADAFASFVRTPPEVDAALVTRITGLDLNLPEVGECQSGPPERDTSIPLSPLRRVELLSAGDVSLETPEGRVDLAPRAFPAVTDVVSGVVYTTRDRAAALPAGVPYALNAAGGASLAPIAVSAEAPAALDGVSLAGTALTPGVILPATDVELRWNPGGARDIVYVTVGTASPTAAVTCTFRDSAGRGLLKIANMPRSENMNLSVHRLRTVALGSIPGSGIDAGELRFDFELSVPLAISEP